MQRRIRKRFFGEIMKITLILLFIGLSFFCKKPLDRIEFNAEKKETKYFAIVVSSVGDSRIIHSDLTEEKAALGSSFGDGDAIIVGSKSKVDVQIGKSSIIRIEPNSKIDFLQIPKSQLNGDETKIQISSGKVFAIVTKENKNDSFEILTPTLVTQVRGTSFIVEVKNSDSSLVKLSQGTLRLTPRIIGLEKLTTTEIESDNGLKKLNGELKKSEIILEKDQQIEIKSNDEILSASSFDKESLQKIITLVGSFTKIKSVDLDLNKNELQEFKTILFVEPKVAMEMARLNDDLSSGKFEDKKAESLEKKRSELDNQVSAKQDIQKAKFNEAIVVKPKKLQSKKEIVKYYERIEKIILADGRVEIGAIINQEDSIIIIHTESGIVRVNKNEIIEVVYDYQTKVKY
jgi:hypothetical protein